MCLQTVAVVEEGHASCKNDLFQQALLRQTDFMKLT